jgi:drug/metabolite transporter (DMT)-like permease
MPEDVILLGQNSTVEVAPEHWPSAATRVKGISLCLVGVMCISPDGALLEQQAFWGVNNWVAILYKFSFAFCFSTLSATVIQGGPCQTVKALHGVGWRYILLQGAAQSLQGVLMSLAFLWTSVAKVLCLFALNPIWALLAARCWESQPVTLAQILVVLSLAVSVILVFMPNIGGFAAANPQWQQNSDLALLGDVAAASAGICLTLTMMISVAASKAGIPKTAMSNSVPVGNAISGIVMLVICAVAGIVPLPNPTSVSQTSSIAVALLNGGCIVVYYSVAVVAPWYISTLDVSLIYLLELPFGPLLAWMVLGVPVSAWAIAGLTLMIVTLALHETHNQWKVSIATREEEETSTFCDRNLDWKHLQHDVSTTQKKSPENDGPTGQGTPGRLSTTWQPVPSQSTPSRLSTTGTPLPSP